MPLQPSQTERAVARLVLEVSGEALADEFGEFELDEAASTAADADVVDDDDGTGDAAGPVDGYETRPCVVDVPALE